MFGDVYNNRSRSLPDSPAGGEPSPLLTRLLIPGEQDAEDGSGFAARTTTRDGHGEPPPSSGAGIDIRRSPAGVESESSRRPLLGGGDSPRGVDPASRPLHRDAPLPSTSSTDRIYAFDPWTKVPVILRRRPSHDHDDDDDDDRARPPRVLTLRWCWLLDDPSWWVAFCYLVGSVGFAAGVGSVGARHPRASCVNTLTNHRTRGARGRRACVHERMNRVHLAHQVVVEAWC